MRDHGRPGREGEKCEKLTEELVLRQTLRLQSNYPSCPTNFHLKKGMSQASRRQRDAPQTWRHIKKKKT